MPPGDAARKRHTGGAGVIAQIHAATYDHCKSMSEQPPTKGKVKVIKREIDPRRDELINIRRDLISATRKIEKMLGMSCDCKK